MTAPPPVLDCARVLELAVLDESVSYSGQDMLLVGGKELGRVPCLALCKYKEQSEILLFHCDYEWTVLGCSGHDSIADAKSGAERIYPGVSARWVDAHVSEEKAEQYLDELFGDERCSFCGKRADQVEQLIQKETARICDRCVTEFREMLRASED